MTAQDARLISEQNVDLGGLEVYPILKTIKKAAEKGSFDILTSDVSKDSITALEERGFKVSRLSAKWIKISW